MVVSSWSERIETLISNIGATLGSSTGGGDGSGGTVATIYTQVINANDYQQTVTYEGQGTPNERITQVTYTSPALGKTVTETILYGDAPESYRVTGRTRSVA